MTEKIDPKKKKQLLDRAKARQILTEILDFGISDSQIQELIKLLALELEDRETMLKIFEFLNEESDAIEVETVKVFT
jgi:hypothetical protein